MRNCNALLRMLHSRVPNRACRLAYRLLGNSLARTGLQAHQAARLRASAQLRRGCSPWRAEKLALCKVADLRCVPPFARCPGRLQSHQQRGTSLVSAADQQILVGIRAGRTRMGLSRAVLYAHLMASLMRTLMHASLM